MLDKENKYLNCKNYQERFNLLNRSISGILSLSPDTQKRVRGELYDFSDALKDKDLFKDGDKQNGKEIHR